jgi:hypothetical protein
MHHKKVWILKSISLVGITLLALGSTSRILLGAELYGTTSTSGSLFGRIDPATGQFTEITNLRHIGLPTFSSAFDANNHRFFTVLEGSPTLVSIDINTGNILSNITSFLHRILEYDSASDTLF